MYSSTMQCDPSDRDRDLACCWLKQKIVSDFPDFNGVSIPVKHARVLKPRSHSAGMAPVHPGGGQPVYRDEPGHFS